ncbi:MAG: hypothetical protein HY873_13245 [Chloroflexi bacterium]|nr:hypothetical protein [Chloroflexota bacterium]
MIVAEATYQRKTITDDWYDVLIHDTRIGEVYRTKHGYFGTCANAPKTILGPTRKKEELAQLLLAKWESFPVDPNASRGGGGRGESSSPKPTAAPISKGRSQR